MKTVFFGDSLTAGFIQLDSISSVVNLGISGNKTIDLIGRIYEVIDNQPDQVFLLIGTNDYLVTEGYWQIKLTIDFTVLYHALVTLLKDNLPDATIYAVSIPPVQLRETYDSVKANMDIDQLNLYIKEETELFQTVFLDLNSALKNKDNMIDKDYTTDGVHFTPLGYQVYFDLVRKYLS